LLKDETLIANVFVPIILAEAALRHGVRLVQVSSGCIFHYDYSKGRPIDEKKIPDYFDLFYSRTKIYSEQVLKILASKYPFLIVRLRIPLDNRPHQKNILDKVIRYKRIINVPNSITYIPDFIKALKYLIRIKATGVYNIVNKGGLRYAQLLDVYKKYVPSFKYKIIPLKNLKLTRTNLLLSTQKLEKAGFRIRKISEVLEECVKNYLKY
jgi:3,5-epimerase/4-reductase